jgi:C4-dicarboxylate-specific signal transduction histidine kinase
VIGHELRNRLAAVAISFRNVRNELSRDVSAATARHLSLAEHETAKAATPADDLATFVRPRELKKTEIDLSDLFRDVLGSTPHPDNVELLLNVEPSDVVGDLGPLPWVLNNLVINGYLALADGWTLRLKWSFGEPCATIVVEDTGRGVDKDGHGSRVRTLRHEKKQRHGNGPGHLAAARPERARMNLPPKVFRRSALRFEGKGKRSVGHEVFSGLVKPVAPRCPLDEVVAALSSGVQM